MTRTWRRRDLKKPVRDGKCWRGCDGLECPWCRDNRTNKKQKEVNRANEIMNDYRFFQYKARRYI